MLKQAAKVNSNFGPRFSKNTMKKIISQIYEIQTPAEAEQVIALGVDHVGSVIVSADNWKQPEIKQTLDLVRKTTANTSLILLYNDPDRVFASLDFYQPDIVHFCEILTDNPLQIAKPACRRLIALQTAIREKFPEIKIMRTIPIPAGAAEAGTNYLELAAMFGPVSDFFLTDTVLVNSEKPEDQPVSGFVGITGKTCSWAAAARLVEKSPIPVILAGGLSPDNVYAAIKAVGPAGVDSCTLTNACDGQGRPIRFKKDMAKVRRFLAETRRAASDLCSGKR